MAYAATAQESHVFQPPVALPYQPWRLNGPYDVIVVGSDFASLSSAACLARLGQKVLVLESGAELIAAAPVFEGNGYRWYPRADYFGAAGQPQDFAHQLTAFISEGRTAWLSSQENNDTVVINGESFGLIAGHKNFAQSVVRHFPRETKTVERYIDYVNQACALAEQQDFALLAPWPWVLLNKYRGQHPLLHKTTTAVLRELTHNEKLIALLTANWADLGIPPQESLFVQHALHVRQKLMGSFYPAGGTDAVINDTLQTICAAGGCIFRHAQVERLLLRDDHAVGVEMVDGQCIYAGQIISADHLPGFQAEPLSRNSADAMAHMTLYIGLNRSAEILNLPRTDYWIYPDSDYQRALDNFRHNASAEFPALHIAFSPLNQAVQLRASERGTIEIKVPVPCKWFSRWPDKTSAQQDADYAAFTAPFSKRLIEMLLKRFPHLAEHIDFYELVTPLFNKPPTPASSAYGVAAMPLKNVHIARSGRLPGMPGSLYAGIICATRVAGFTYMKMRRQIFPRRKKNAAVLAG